MYTPRWWGACIDPSHPRLHGMVHRSSVSGMRRVSHIRDTTSTGYGLWTHWDLNPGPPPCKGGALPLSYGPVRRTVLALVVHGCPVGSVCPMPPLWARLNVGSRSVEVIQPQIPLRLPCYDLSPLAKPRFDHRTMASSGPHSGALTGGVCKEQGRIRRALLTRDYYRIQLHEGGLQPSIRTTTEFRGLALSLGIASHCLGHCSPRVARHIRGILTYRCPFLPPL